MLALSRLSMVMKALTPRHFDVVVCLAKKLKSSPELGGEKEYNAGIGIWEILYIKTGRWLAR